MEFIHFCNLLVKRWIVSMVRCWMVRIWHPNLGICTTTDLPCHHVGTHSREIGLIGQQHQIKHQLCMLFIRRWHTSWLVNFRKLATTLLFGPLNTTLDIPNGLQIFINPHPVIRSEITLQHINLVTDGIQDALVLLDTSKSCCRVSRTGISKKPFEHCSWIVFTAKWRCFTSPCNRIRVRAAKPDIARPRYVSTIKCQFQRRELRVLFEFPSNQLVNGYAGLNI